MINKESWEYKLYVNFMKEAFGYKIAWNYLFFICMWMQDASECLDVCDDARCM